jgi:hypothetical protein
MLWLGDEIRLVSWGEEDRSAVVKLFNHVNIHKVRIESTFLLRGYRHPLCVTIGV